MIRVELPFHLRRLAQVEGEVQLTIEGRVTVTSVLHALESRYPTLKGLIRDHSTLRRRPFIRVFACKEDWSHESPDAELPPEIISGAEPLLIVGAMAGG